MFWQKVLLAIAAAAFVAAAAVAGDVGAVERLFLAPIHAAAVALGVVALAAFVHRLDLHDLNRQQAVGQLRSLRLLDDEAREGVEHAAELLQDVTDRGAVPVIFLALLVHHPS